MTDRFRITLAQLNPVVGDLDGNAAKARAAWETGRAAGADLVALPEMFVTGHPIRDLALKPPFAAAAMETVRRLAADCADGPALAIGGPFAEGGRLHNAYWICQGGRVTALVLKHVLANHGVFDESRVYDAGPISGPVAVGPVRIGAPIGEDAWHEDVAEAQAESGAEILLVPNGSPYHRGKHDLRLGHVVARVIETGLPMVYLNMVGGQDDQVFDGGSFVLNPGGALARQMPFCDDEIDHVEFTRADDGWRATDGERARLPDEWEADYRIMVEGLRDYLRKSGFTKVVLSLTGGADSALVAAIAADALGPANLRCVMLSSDETAAEVARRLGCRLDEVPIEGPRRAMSDALGSVIEGAGGVTEDNVRARVRAVGLMALSDAYGEMLLTAGDKTDLALGNARHYDDMAGGYNPIKDLYKSRVVETCRWRNAHHRPWMLGPGEDIIPPGIYMSGPRDDGDRLSPCEALDDILEQLIDRDASVGEVVSRGHDRETVRQVEGLIQQSEHARNRSAPGPRLTSRTLGLDRRYPIVNRWRDTS